MKTKLYFLVLLVACFSCTTRTELSPSEKIFIETEIHQFMDTLDAAFESVSPERIYNNFLQTGEFAMASRGGYLMNSPSALLDTMKVHMALMKSQTIEPVSEKIYIVNNKAVVISTSRISTLTLKDESQFTMPYTLTMLLVKKDGKWKIAHYHN
jgi:hypothetical protein